MTSKKINTFLSMLFLVATLNTGCEKLIEIDAPLNEITSETVFASDATAKGALAGLYATLSQSQNQLFNLTAYSSLQADDLLYLTQGVATYNEFMVNNHVTTSSSVASVWSEWYSIIYRTNALINGLSLYSGTSAAVNKQLTAEARFVRAYCYFNLVNQFGDVPLVLETDVAKTAYLPRTATADVYQQIIKDLTEAKNGLLSDYSYTSQSRVGPTSFAASALLARVYLFTGDYASAEAMASEVIASSLYSIVPKATIGTGVFVANSPECIWQISPYLASTNQYTYEGASFIPSAYTAAGIFWRINPNLIAAFDANDERLAKWTIRTTVNSVNYHTPNKYKYRTNALAVSAGISEYPIILRLAEQYLIRAEARARLGTNVTGALSDLNVIRLRAGLSASTTTVQSTLINEILLEKRKEFFCEQGFRWFDLKRTGNADAVLGVLKPTWNTNAKLFPIPQDAVDKNYNLIQNPGY